MENLEKEKNNKITLIEVVTKFKLSWYVPLDMQHLAWKTTISSNMTLLWCHHGLDIVDHQQL